MSVSSFVRPAWRALRRSPAFAVTASLTLVLGIAAAIAIFTVVDGVLLRPLPYAHPDRLVGVWHDLPGVGIHKANQTSATYFTYQKLARTLDGIAVYQGGAVNVSDPSGGSEPQRVDAAFVSATLLPTLEVRPMLGRNFSAAEDLPKGPDVVLISDEIWKTRFGGAHDVLGKTLQVNGKSREIIGVMPSGFGFPSARTRLWLPMQLDPAAPFPGGFSYDAVARMKVGVSVDDVNRDLMAVMPRMVELSPNLAPGVSTQMLIDQAKPRPFVVPLKDDITGGIAKTLWIVAAAAVLVLLVACANVTNLILVRADARQRELAVREALGAGRARVLGHFLAESVVITAVAGIVGLAVAAVAIRLLVATGPADIPRLSEVHVGLATVVFAIVVSAIVALVCSIIPALRLGSLRLSLALREGGRSGTAGRVQQRVRSALVATQIAFALVALAGSALLLRTFQRLNAVKPGFDGGNVATFWMALPGARYTSDTARARFYTVLLDRVRELPGVQEAGITSRLPLSSTGMNQNPFYPENDPSYATKIPPLQIFTTVDGGYFHAMRIPLVAGRTFGRLDTQGQYEAVISQATAYQFWKDSSGRAALGKRFRELPGSNDWYTVVGVVGNVRDTALAAPPSQTVYFPEVASANPDQSQTRSTMALVVRSSLDATALTPLVQRTVRDLDATLPLFDVRPMTGVVRAATAQLSFTIVIIAAAAFVTLVLGAIGLYGVMAYIVALRSRELGVRIALGASPSSVVAMLTRQGVVLTAAGIVGGLALFAVVARFLRALLFGVAPSDPIALVTAATLLVVVAALASWLPARRSARLDPAVVLRAE